MTYDFSASKLSILILTHNRPKLFKRCIESVMDNCPESTEIIVNNDTRDIEEIKGDNIIYYYNKFQLTEIYKFLVSRAHNEYIYFLEDDDYLANNFYDKVEMYLNGENDLIIGKYYSCDKTLSFENSASNDILRISHIKKDFNIEDEMFQLGQVIFKRSIFDSFEWFNDNDIHNDYKMVKNFINKYKYLTVNKIFYHQTCDGKDNISFPEYAQI